MPVPILRVKCQIDNKDKPYYTSFSIGEGDVCGIVGEAEATQYLLELLSGIRKSHKGSIEINGVTEKIKSIRKARKKRHRLHSF